MSNGKLTPVWLLLRGASLILIVLSTITTSLRYTYAAPAATPVDSHCSCTHHAEQQKSDSNVPRGAWAYIT